MTHHKINIKLRGCNEFVEKFPDGSSDAAKSLARSRYPDAIRIEWKGACQSDDEEPRDEQKRREYRASVQETYDRMDAKTVANCENQRQLDANNNSNGGADYDHYSEGGGGVGGCLSLILMGVVGLGAMFVIPGGVSSFVDGFCSTAEICKQSEQNSIDQTPAEVDHRWSNDPCTVWANANRSLADRLQPGDKCYGF